MQSHGNPECFARSVINEMLPFESGAMMNRFFSLVSPPTASGHGCNLCQARLRASVSASVSPTMPKSIATIADGADMPLAAGLAYERSMISLVLDTEDAHEGCAAFVEKRQAKFTGR